MFELEPERASILPGAATVKHAGHLGFGIDPLAFNWRREGHDDLLSGEHWISGADEHPIERQVYDPVSDQAEVPLTNDLAGNMSGMTKWTTGL